LHAVVIVGIGSENFAQVGFAEYKDVVEAFTANRAAETFYMSVLPRRPRSNRPICVVPGMSLELEPNACLGTKRVNIGASVIVTETGAEALNDLPTRVFHRRA